MDGGQKYYRLTVSALTVPAYTHFSIDCAKQKKNRQTRHLQTCGNWTYAKFINPSMHTGITVHSTQPATALLRHRGQAQCFPILHNPFGHRTQWEYTGTVEARSTCFFTARSLIRQSAAFFPNFYFRRRAFMNALHILTFSQCFSTSKFCSLRAMASASRALRCCCSKMPAW